MKVVTLETLTAAMENLVSGHRVVAQEAYDALPTAPLAEDVRAAVERMREQGQLWETFENQSMRAWGANITIIIAALHAATAAQAAAEADRERLRVIAARLAESDPIMLTFGQYMCRYCFGEGDLGSVGHRSGCVWMGAQVLLGALAATPTPDVVGVPKAEYERLKRMEERAIEVDVRLRKYTPGWDEVSYILHDEATDARP